MENDRGSAVVQQESVVYILAQTWTNCVIWDEANRVGCVQCRM